MVSMATPYMNLENGGRPTDSNLSRGILILDYPIILIILILDNLHEDLKS